MRLRCEGPCVRTFFFLFHEKQGKTLKRMEKMLEARVSKAIWKEQRNNNNGSVYDRNEVYFVINVPSTLPSFSLIQTHTHTIILITKVSFFFSMTSQLSRSFLFTKGRNFFTFLKRNLFFW